ncbi:MAG: preprotein translocase subunit SecE [Propionibacterium sp.]|nr:MAG: preprotein translocase subunit SecE [Propionibacterium sp.]
MTFTKQSIGELKKVNWPTAEQMRVYFIAVLIFVLFVIAFVSLFDVAFGALLLKIFG